MSKKVVKAKGPSKTFSSKNAAKPLTGKEKNGSSRNPKDFEFDSSSDLDSSNDSSTSEVEVKFELFNMAEPDYHSVKQYLNNLFGAGDHGVDLVGLTAFIVEDLADHLGTCIKTDGETSDPFGFITGASMSFFREKAPQGTLDSLINYLKVRCRDFDIESFASEPNNVIVFQERLINVPSSISAPLHRQFLDDWQMAASEPVSSKHFNSPARVLLLTPTYKEVASKLDREMGVQADKFGVTATGINFYYEETEGLVSLCSESFDYAVNTGHETSDSRRAFSDAGIEPGRRAFVLPSWKSFTEYICLLEKENIE